MSTHDGKPAWLRAVPDTPSPLNVFRKEQARAAHRPDLSPEQQVTIGNAEHQLRNPTGDPMTDLMVEDLWYAFNNCLPGDMQAYVRILRQRGWTHR